MAVVGGGRDDQTATGFNLIPCLNQSPAQIVTIAPSQWQTAPLFGGEILKRAGRDADGWLEGADSTCTATI